MIHDVQRAGIQTSVDPYPICIHLFICVRWIQIYPRIHVPRVCFQSASPSLAGSCCCSPELPPKLFKAARSPKKPAAQSSIEGGAAGSQTRTSGGGTTNQDGSRRSLYPLRKL